MDYHQLRHRARRFVIASTILVCVPFSTGIILAAIFLKGLWPAAIFGAMAVSLYTLPSLFKRWLVRAVGPCPHCGSPKVPGATYCPSCGEPLARGGLREE